MDKLLIAQRILIYSLALEHLEEIWFCGLCHSLRVSAGILGVNDNDAVDMAYHYMETEYPEVWDHRPDKNIDAYSVGYWWPVGYKSTRIGVLQECIEELYNKL